MKHPFRSLGEIERELGNMAIEITRARFMHFTASRAWAPAINAFRCGEQYLICAELAGVDRSAIEVRAEPRRVTIRGDRPTPEPSCDDSPALQVHALEIDHGPFERVIELPEDIDPNNVTAEHRNGMLWIKLPLRSHA